MPNIMIAYAAASLSVGILYAVVTIIFAEMARAGRSEDR